MSCNSLQHSGLPPDMFYTMKSLREIDVSACNLSTLPERFVGGRMLVYFVALCLPTIVAY